MSRDREVARPSPRTPQGLIPLGLHMAPRPTQPTFAWSLLCVWVLSTALVAGTSLGSSVSASSVPKLCSLWAVCLTMSAKLSMACKGREVSSHSRPPPGLLGKQDRPPHHAGPGSEATVSAQHQVQVSRECPVPRRDSGLMARTRPRQSSVPSYLPPETPLGMWGRLTVR